MVWRGNDPSDVKEVRSERGGGICRVIFIRLIFLLLLGSTIELKVVGKY